MKHKKFSISDRLKSFKYAVNGIRTLLIEEHNSRIHFLAAFVAIALALILKINKLEWIFIIFSIGIVITMEIMNTAMENLADFVSPGKHEEIKKIKDLAAAAVLVAALTACGTGIIIFLPKILNIIR